MSIDQVVHRTTLVGLLVALVVVLGCHAVYWRSPPTAPASKTFTLRINDIPAVKSQDDLESELRSILSQYADRFKDTTVTVHHCAKTHHRRHTACATATFRSSLSARAVAQQLQQHDASFNIDDKFYGVTHLYDCGAVAVVE